MRSSRCSEEEIVAVLEEHDEGEARRLKALEEENARLKRLVAEQALDNQALKELLRKNW